MDLGTIIADEGKILTTDTAYNKEAEFERYPHADYMRQRRNVELLESAVRRGPKHEVSLASSDYDHIDFDKEWERHLTDHDDPANIDGVVHQQREFFKQLRMKHFGKPNNLKDVNLKNIMPTLNQASKPTQCGHLTQQNLPCKHPISVGSKTCSAGHPVKP